MDDLYAINAAKSEFREFFNLADTSRMLAIADPDLVNFSGRPTERIRARRIGCLEDATRESIRTL